MFNNIAQKKHNLILSILFIFSQNLFCMENAVDTVLVQENTQEYQPDFNDKVFFNVLDKLLKSYITTPVERKKDHSIFKLIPEYVLEKIKETVKTKKYDHLIKFLNRLEEKIKASIDSQDKIFEFTKVCQFHWLSMMIHYDNQLIESLLSAKYLKIDRDNYKEIYFWALSRSKEMFQFFFYYKNELIEDKGSLLEYIFNSLPSFRNPTEENWETFVDWTQDALNETLSKEIYRNFKISELCLDNVENFKKEKIENFMIICINLLKKNQEIKIHELFLKFFINALSYMSIRLSKNIINNLVTDQSDNEDIIIKIYLCIKTSGPLIAYDSHKILIKNCLKYNKKKFLKELKSIISNKVLRNIIFDMKFKRELSSNFCCVPYIQIVEKELTQSEKDCLDLIDPDKIVSSNSEIQMQISDPKETESLLKEEN